MPRILIVDDAGEARAILAIALSTIDGVTVETAESAESALQAIGAEPVDVLITDVRMSGMNGLELLAALRERGAFPVRGAVVISGETDPDLPQRALESGASEFFAKPFSAAAVRKRVVSLLSGGSV
jgi:CheY-like chemotaxis protein